MCHCLQPTIPVSLHCVALPHRNRSCDISEASSAPRHSDTCTSQPQSISAGAISWPPIPTPSTSTPAAAANVVCSQAIEPLEADFALLTRRETVQWLTGVHVRYPFAANRHSCGPTDISRSSFPTGKSKNARPPTKSSVTKPNGIRPPATSSSLPARPSSWKKSRRSPSESRANSKLSRRNCCSSWNATLVEIDAIVFDLRRRKDADELRLLTRANEANRAMYERGREIVRPGANELDIYSELQSVAVHVLGEPPTYFGQDFRSNARGGAPRDRQIQAGELMILDLGVGFRGYHSDNARTLAVGGEPTEMQQQAWKSAAGVFDIIQSQARPGVSCRALFDEAQRHLDKFLPGVFNHHLGPRRRPRAARRPAPESVLGRYTGRG